MSGHDAPVVAVEVLSFDPGKSNLGVWRGTVCIQPHDDGSVALAGVRTRLMEKLELTGKGGAPAVCADCVLGRDATGGFVHQWVRDPNLALVLVETQAQQNVPARVIASTLYALFRGLYADNPGTAVEMSVRTTKSTAIDAFAERYNVRLEPKGPVGKTASEKERARRENKRRALDVVAGFMEHRDSGAEERGAWADASYMGRAKRDDMADAMLLGVGGAMLSLKRPCKLAARERRAAERAAERTRRADERALKKQQARDRRIYTPVEEGEKEAVPATPKKRHAHEPDGTC